MYLQGFQFGIPPVQAESGQPLWNNAGTLAGMAGVTWDNVNERIGWGTNAPAAVVHAVANSSTEIPLIAQQGLNSTVNTQEWRNNAGTIGAYLWIDSSNTMFRLQRTADTARYIAVENLGASSQLVVRGVGLLQTNNTSSPAIVNLMTLCVSDCKWQFYASGGGQRTHTISGGDPPSNVTQDGNNLVLRGGDSADAGGTDRNGGHLYLRGGTAKGAGIHGHVIISDLPTSPVGLPANALWNDSGTLKIV